MIFSTTYRQVAQTRGQRAWVARECNRLDALSNDITRVHVVFSQCHHRRRKPDQICCHLQVHLAGSRDIDVFECANDAGSAFTGALQRIERRIVRSVKRRRDHAAVAVQELLATDCIGLATEATGVQA